MHKDYILPRSALSPLTRCYMTFDASMFDILVVFFFTAMEGMISVSKCVIKLSSIID